MDHTMNKAIDIKLPTIGATLSGAASRSARSLTEDCLAAIEDRNPLLNVFLAVDREGARAQAEQADKAAAAGAEPRQLSGIPIGIKDVLAIEGQPATAGSKILEGYRPPYTATAVHRLIDAGAVILGKLNCDEFAMGSSNENSA
jgi:aspartyl-tRNA(Asn)/glutamyl-tRNA(Gln) amidotransferase subunit A